MAVAPSHSPDMFSQKVDQSAALAIAVPGVSVDASRAATLRVCCVALREL